MSKIRFYLDENVQIEVSAQLVQRGIEALCTCDQDFLRMSAENVEHAGIIFARQYKSTIGGWVRELSRAHETRTAETMLNHIEYVRVQ